MSLPAKEFKITKKLISDYTVTPLSPNSQHYTVDIASHGSMRVPYLFLHEGTATKDTKTIVGSVRCVGSLAFEINCNGFNDEVGSLTMMRRAPSRDANMKVGMASGTPRELAWRRTAGMKFAIKLSDLKEPDTVLATFKEERILGRGGKLKLNVDWGLDFERTVITSFVALFEKISIWGKGQATGSSQVLVNGTEYAAYAPMYGYSDGGGGCCGGDGGGGGGC